MDFTSLRTLIRRVKVTTSIYYVCSTTETGVMPDISKYMSPSAIASIRQFVTEAGGREVFVLGTTDDDRTVDNVTIFARGNEFSAPALLQVAAQGDVVIHNHPSGRLEPSEADVQVASQLGNSGVGFYIVDNNISDIYVVVEAFERKEVVPLNAEEIGRIIEPGGPISKRLKGYEHRPQQLEMIACICQAFNEDKIAIIEAGTGTGKTLAYLLPAVYWAVNNKERCAVSTNTINLQEQLIKKDIPFLQSVLDVEFKAVLVKGRSNYACLRKVEELESDFDLLVEREEVQELKTLIGWARSSRDGSKADLNFVPKNETWEKIASESDTCIRTKCSFYRKCFVNRARREANKADILVVNHHLLFADLAVRNTIGDRYEIAVLPSYQRLILDEAHNIEDVATNYFGFSVTRLGISRSLGRLHRRKGDVLKGHLHYLKAKLYQSQKKISKKLFTKLLSFIDQTLTPSVEALVVLNNEVMEKIFQAVQARVETANGEIKLRLTESMRQEEGWRTLVVEGAKTLAAELRILSSKLSALCKLLQSGDSRAVDGFLSLQTEIAAQSERLDMTANTIEHVLLQGDDSYIRWIEAKQRAKGNIVRLRSSPLEVAETMRDKVYLQFKTVVMTSATLAVEGLPGLEKFDFLKQRIGLDLVRRERILETVLPAPFDYKRQAIIGIPLDIPTPGHPDFADTLSKLIFKALTITEGRAFLLFTSYGLLNKIHAQLQGPLQLLGINSLKQGAINRHRLLEHFRRDTSSVLFGTDSFWEGVDVEGKALEAVIITKLPFKVPTEPIIEARVEAIRRRGGNPFMEYIVPQATIRFKQGFGRLIRRKTDRGSILIFDKRVVEKNYGVTFLRSLPPCNVITGTKEKVLAELKNFFLGAENAPSPSRDGVSILPK